MKGLGERVYAFGHTIDSEENDGVYITTSVKELYAFMRKTQVKRGDVCLAVHGVMASAVSLPNLEDLYAKRINAYIIVSGTKNNKLESYIFPVENENIKILPKVLEALFFIDEDIIQYGSDLFNTVSDIQFYCDEQTPEKLMIIYGDKVLPSYHLLVNDLKAVDTKFFAPLAAQQQG